MARLNLTEALAVVESIRLTMTEEGLDEKDMNPFKNWKKLGNASPGGRSDFDKAGKWKCKKSGKYVQKCKGIHPDTEGQTKIVRINKGYKKSYNADYKKFMAKGKKGGIPAKRSGNTKGWKEMLRIRAKRSAK